jgi:Raf kinase inhibitor-like YbhB/YbcL family protein
MIKYRLHHFYLLTFSLLLILNVDFFYYKINEGKMNFKISSPSFKEGELIPTKYTCDGANTSPPLMWTAPPEKTKSFALINDDPDAPIGDWVHWILFNVPADAKELKEESSSKHTLPKGTIEGMNDFRKNNYGGPCPPSGTHRYFFKLYALDLILNLKEGSSKNDLEKAMVKHIITESSLMAKYSRR